MEKTFFIKEYFQNYSSALNNSQKTEIKNYFIQLIQRLKEYNIIESNFKILQDGNFFKTPELTSKNINEGFVIYEKLNI